MKNYSTTSSIAPTYILRNGTLSLLRSDRAHTAKATATKKDQLEQECHRLVNQFRSESFDLYDLLQTTKRIWRESRSEKQA